LIAACGIDKTSRVYAPWAVILRPAGVAVLTTKKACCRIGVGSRDSMQMSVDRMAKSNLSPFHFYFQADRI